MDSPQPQVAAGVTFVAIGALLLLGFTTAEAFYPGYSTSMNTISALGAARGTPASQLVFNSVMAVAGVLTVFAAYALHRAWDRRELTGALGVTGVVGFIGVGAFPSQTGLPHFIAALVSFAGVGVLALLVARAVRGPFRVVSAGLGVLELLALGLFIGIGGGTPLGIGGLERWVAYLGVVWVVALGGFLLADT